MLSIAAALRHQQLGQFLTTFGGHNRPVAFTNVLA